MKRIALFVFGLAVLGALIWYAGAGAIVRALGALGPFGLVGIALLHLPTIAAMGVAWWSVRGLTPAGALRRFLVARLIRDAAGEVLPFSQLGGFAIGARALALSGVDLFRGALSMFADLVMEFAAKLPYTVIGLVVLFALQPGAALLQPVSLGVAATAAGLAAIFVFRRPLLARLERTALAVVRRWTSLAPRSDVAPAIAATFAPRGLLTCFTIHLFCWLMGAFETWVIFWLLGTPVTIAQAVVIDSLANGLRTFAFFIPAAAGAQEGAYVLVCALFGLSPATAIAFSLARRARELVLGVPGLAAWQILESRSLPRAVQIVGRKTQPPA
jgi:putative membrane protein